MDSCYRMLAPPEPCVYLPDQVQRMEYQYVAALGADEFLGRMLNGWRRFGHTLFRPRCPACQGCRSLRVDSAAFRPDRSQRRARKKNEGRVELRIGSPALSGTKVDLLARFHADRERTRGWPAHEDDDLRSYHVAFLDNPFPTQEWCYLLEGELVGVGYVDELPAGLSAIYFFHDPARAEHSLGTWNILCLIERARALRLQHVYLGYYVAGCPSLAYKARFAPNQVLGRDGRWHDFRP